MNLPKEKKEEKKQKKNRKETHHHHHLPPAADGVDNFVDKSVDISQVREKLWREIEKKLSELGISKRFLNRIIERKGIPVDFLAYELLKLHCYGWQCELGKVTKNNIGKIITAAAWARQQVIKITE